MAQQTQQEVLRSDVIIAQQSGLLRSQTNGAFAARCQLHSAMPVPRFRRRVRDRVPIDSQYAQQSEVFLLSAGRAHLSVHVVAGLQAEMGDLRLGDIDILRLGKCASTQKSPS